MKHTLNLHVLSFALASSLLISACTGNKQESTGNENEVHHMEKMKTDSSTQSVAVKAFENVDAAVKTQLNGFLSDYFALNKALIEDNQETAKAAAKKLAETINKFDMRNLAGEQMDFYHKQLATLTVSLKAISESSDIEETRADLSAISESMYALVKAYQPNAAELYYQFCPMAKNGDGANWLSETKEVVNPYMGQRMLKCGTTKEVLTFVK